MSVLANTSASAPCKMSPLSVVGSSNLYVTPVAAEFDSMKEPPISENAPPSIDAAKTATAVGSTVSRPRGVGVGSAGRGGMVGTDANVATGVGAVAEVAAVGVG